MNNNMYQVKPYKNNYNYGDRQFFFPFLTRPRPIYNVAPNPGYPGPRPPYYAPGAPYSYSSYGGYIPGPYGY